MLAFETAVFMVSDSEVLCAARSAPSGSVPPAGPTVTLTGDAPSPALCEPESGRPSPSLSCCLGHVMGWVGGTGSPQAGLAGDTVLRAGLASEGPSALGVHGAHPPHYLKADAARPSARSPRLALLLSARPQGPQRAGAPAGGQPGLGTGVRPGPRAEPPGSLDLSPASGSPSGSWEHLRLPPLGVPLAWPLPRGGHGLRLFQCVIPQHQVPPADSQPTDGCPRAWSSEPNSKQQVLFWARLPGGGCGPGCWSESAGGEGESRLGLLVAKSSLNPCQVLSCESHGIEEPFNEEARLGNAEPVAEMLQLSPTPGPPLGVRPWRTSSPNFTRSGRWVWLRDVCEMPGIKRRRRGVGWGVLAYLHV